MSNEQDGYRSTKATDAVVASTERVASKPARDARAIVNDDGTKDGVERATEGEGTTVLEPDQTVQGRELGTLANDTSGDNNIESSSPPWVAVKSLSTPIAFQSSELRQREH